MGLVPLDMAALDGVRGGLIGAMFAKAMSRMADDLASAPELDSWREVTIKIRAKPIFEGGELHAAALEFDVRGKVPSRTATAMAIVRQDRRNGQRQFVYQEDAPDNAFQASLLDEQDSTNDEE